MCLGSDPPLESDTGLLESNHRHVGDHSLQVCSEQSLFFQNGGRVSSPHFFHCASAGLAINSAEPPEWAHMSRVRPNAGQQSFGNSRQEALLGF